MITLLEHEGKAQLRGAGIAVPQGFLYSDEPMAALSGYVVKAQIPAGGRGKLGGIQVVDDEATAREAARALLQRGMLGEHPIESIYVEERLDIEREIYLSISIDRDAGCPVVIACAEGGVEIESVPAERIVRQQVDPSYGLEPFAIDRIVRELNIPAALKGEFESLLRKLADFHVKNDCELVEINPLVMTRDQRLIAADCKLALDEDAAFRHAGWKRTTPRGTPFEERARELGVIGVEIAPEGRVVAIMNGAGMTMATLDELVESQHPPRAVVELHGITAHDSSGLEQTLQLCVDELQPDVVFLNVHFQFRRLDIVAQALLAAIAQRGAAPKPHFVVRLKGVRREDAVEMLAGAPIFLTDSFSEAIAEINRLLEVN